MMFTACHSRPLSCGKPSESHRRGMTISLVYVRLTVLIQHLEAWRTSGLFCLQQQKMAEEVEDRGRQLGRTGTSTGAAIMFVSN